jgi:hypothetical protein
VTTHKPLQEILRLNPQRDHLRIVYLDTCYEFPFDLTRADEFALYRTFAVPSIASLLAHTGEFTTRTQRRYDDTKLLLSELVESGYDTERGRQALRRMNHLHGLYSISNQDFLYVLSTFVFEPPRWMARYGYRPMVKQEKLALFYFWCEIGRRMGIRELPQDIQSFEQFNVEYERQNFRYTDAGHHVAAATRDMFLGWFLPRPLRRLGAPAIHALLDDPLREALGFPKPSPILTHLVRASLRMRGKLSGLLPERRKPFLRIARRHRTYPKGYDIQQLGPPGTAQPSRQDTLEN